MNITHLVMFKFFTGATASVAVEDPSLPDAVFHTNPTAVAEFHTNPTAFAKFHTNPIGTATFHE